MDLLVLILGLILSVFIFFTYRLSGGLFSLPFLVLVYLALLYVGTVNFYILSGHLTFVFVFVMAWFYFIGICVATLTFRFLDRTVEKPLMLYSPLNGSVLKFSLVTIFFITLAIATYRLMIFGIPLFEGTWYTKGIEATMGVSNRLLFNASVEALIVLSLIAYSLYISNGEKSFKSLTVLFFVTYIFFQALNGGKATAVMPFVFFGIAMFYCDHKISKKILVWTGLAIAILVLFIGAFRAASVLPSDIISLFYERVTSIAALHLDFILHGWAPNHSYEFGNTLWLELKRLVAQVTTVPKEPLFNEFIGNLRTENTLDRVTGVSPELSLFGVAYANLGFPGAILSAILLGYVVQRIHWNLKARATMNVFSFTLWIFIVFELLAFVKTGNLFISIQSYFLGLSPAILLLAASYILLGLPFPNALKWKRPCPN